MNEEDDLALTSSSFDQSSEETQAAEAKAARDQILAKLSAEIVGKLQKAVTARAASGIEKTWQEDEEAYDGIDAANREEEAFTNASTRKPDSSGSITETKKSPQRSTILLNITSHYVDAGSARLADMLLPTDDNCWKIKPTPIPDLINELPDDADILTTEIDPQTRLPKSMKKKEVVAAVEQAAQEQAVMATTRIDDWLTQCQWSTHARTVIEDCARIGTGILKGPVPRKQCSKVVMNMGGAKAVVEKEEILPGSRSVNPWNLFPDPACGENIHEGDHVFEREMLTPNMLKELEDLPGYLPDQIRAVLKETPVTHTASGPIRSQADMGMEPYEIWYFTGEVRADVLEGCGCGDVINNGDFKDEEGELKQDTIPVVLTLVNDRVIRAALNPLDDGAFPYDVMVWQRRYGHWAGIGLSRKVRTPQRIVTAATRALMDNAGDSAGVITIINQTLLNPVDGRWSISPKKVFLSTNALGSTPVRDAVEFKEIPSRQVELLNIIEFGIRMAEEVSGLPQLLQGQQGEASKTLGGMQMLNTNAHTTLRRLAKGFDDRITEPHIRRYYAWLLLYGEDEEKGDVVIEAIGSSSLVEKDLQTQGILQAAPMALNPVFGIDPKKYADEWFRAMRIDPERLRYDKGEEPEPAPPPPPPQLLVAKENNQTKIALAEKEQAFQMVMDERQKAFDAQMADMANQLEAMLAQGTTGVDMAQIRAMLAAKQADINADFEKFNAEALLKTRMTPGYFEG